MSFVIFALQLLVWPVVIFALLLLSVAVAVGLVQAALLVGSLGGSPRLRRIYRFASRVFSPAMYLLVGTAALMLMLATVFDVPGLYNAAYIIAVAGVSMGILNWLDKVFAEPLTKADFERAIVAQTETLSKVFAQPLSQSHFDRAMADQAEIIQAGNAQVVAAVQAGNAQVVTALSELTQQMSELSGDIRGLLEVRSGDAGGPALPGDADD